METPALPCTIRRGHEGLQLIDRNGRMWCDGMGSAEAAAILQIANCHDELVAALELLSEQVKSHQRPHDCVGFDCSVCTPMEGLSNAEAVLNKAKAHQ